ncbi:phenazine biosynthesis-like domain-containing protein 1 isoform X2 [Acanthaster planci]|uniref:Phenazine biosynthesis-like domain-containing protein 1 isoform X2 n=1 Tax=Acanthaster planci TaxID=133434 RepID=A0A8B7XQH3_ACAPL|nr:phenazine biosynthesis-like domain-containing protein 1 isoform X2 [Acanthaster planci]
MMASENPEKYVFPGREGKLPIITVDAFTDKPFAGNSAAVCCLGEDIPEETKMKIAAEMNLSETAYLQTLVPGETFQTATHLRIRWFTPTHEVDLCGHATLASAAALFYVVGNRNDAVRFQSRSGELIARRAGAYIGLDFPLNMPSPEDRAPLAQLIQVTIGQHVPQDVYYSERTKKLLLRLRDTETRETLESLQPDFGAMMAAPNPHAKVKGVIVTLKGNPGNGAIDADGKQYDFVSRYFAPWHGLPEDPVTGSAHTVLAGYWAEQLGKKELYARQCSKRGGDIQIRVRDDGRVDLLGKATVVLQGEITL